MNRNGGTTAGWAVALAMAGMLAGSVVPAGETGSRLDTLEAPAPRPVEAAQEARRRWIASTLSDLDLASPFAYGATVALADQGAIEAVPHLVALGRQALADIPRQGAVLAGCVLALGRLGGPEARSFLEVVVAADGTRSVRHYAARGLGAMASETSVPALTRGRALAAAEDDHLGWSTADAALAACTAERAESFAE